MAILYKRFIPLRTVFYALLLGFLYFGMATAKNAQANPVLTVEGVQVDVTAENALKAKEQAFSQAQREAFRILSGRVTGIEYRDEQLPDTATISTMIQDFEVTQERLSSVRYIGTYTFRFDPYNVQYYFGRQIPASYAGDTGASADVAEAPQSGKPVLVLPFFEIQGNSTLWSPSNDWMKAWRRLGAVESGTPILVPIGDIEDVRDLGDQQSNDYDRQKLAGLVARYQASEAVIAVAVPGPDFPAVAAEGDSASGSLSIHLYRTDRGNPEYIQEITLEAGPGQSRAQLFDLAVLRVRNVLQGNWKAQVAAAPAAQGGNKLSVEVSFNTLEQWAQTQQALSRVYGINEVVLKSLSPKVARVDIVYQGTEDRLRNALRQAEITLTSPQSSGSYYAGDYQAGVHQLYLNRFAPSSTHRQPAFQQRF